MLHVLSIHGRRLRSHSHGVALRVHLIRGLASEVRGLHRLATSVHHGLVRIPLLLTWRHLLLLLGRLGRCWAAALTRRRGCSGAAVNVGTS